MLKVNKKATCFVGYVALTTNEVTNIDNQNWVLVHGYVTKDWCQIPIMIIDSSNSNNLTEILIQFFFIKGEFLGKYIIHQRVSFGAKAIFFSRNVEWSFSAPHKNYAPFMV